MTKKSEKTIAKILAAAEDLFLARSYAEVTMDQIAEKADVTKGGLYHHFPGKEALYLEMMQSDMTRMKDLFSRAIEEGAGCRDRLRRLTLAYFSLPRAKNGIIKLFRRDINIFDRSTRAKLVRAYQASLPELVERIIREGIREGELAKNDPRLLAWHFVAMVEVTLGRYAGGVFHSTDKKLDHVLNLFFRGAAAVNKIKEGAIA